MWQAEITILWSWWFQTIPRPCCKCDICVEARKKGHPYTRSGPAIFVSWLNLLIDTPKDISSSINRENINKIENIAYTHRHPDHTEWMRIVEEIKCDRSKQPPYELKNQWKPIQMLLPDGVMDELYKIKSWSWGSYFSWYEYLRLIDVKNISYWKSIEMDNINITPVKVNQGEKLTTAAYLLESKKRVLYVPCDIKPFDIPKEYLQDLDVFIVNCPYFETENWLKKIDANHPIKDELFSMEELVDIISENNIRQTIVTHIEEMWRLSIDDYRKLEHTYGSKNIKFAYDGMKITF